MEKRLKNIQTFEQETAQLDIPVVIWRCNEDITNIYGEILFTKGLVYQQIKCDEYPMMLIDNKVEESEVSNLVDYFTSI